MKPITIVAIVMTTAVTIVLALSLHATLQRVAERQAALCSTDAECAALCRPADAECDGGPQN